MKNIEILDGAMGSEIIRRGYVLPKHIWSAEMNITNKKLVYDIHCDYVNAGSRYLTTNTFRSTPRSYKKAGFSSIDAIKFSKESMNNAVNVAKKAGKGQCLTLGSIAPLEDCYIPEDFPGIETSIKEFLNLSSWLNELDIDIFLLETMNSIIETEVCLKQVSKFDKPIWVSFILKDEKHILSGELLKDCIKMLDDFNVDVLLINCSSMYSINYSINTIIDNWGKRWGAYPNLGIGKPSPNGDIKSIHSDDNFIRLYYNIANAGGSLIGGCCGSSPYHINILNKKIKEQLSIH